MKEAPETVDIDVQEGGDVRLKTTLTPTYDETYDDCGGEGICQEGQITVHVPE